MSARLRLASLWLTHVARILGDWCLRLVVVLEGTALLRGGGWHLATGLFIAPFLLLAPLNGCLSNGLPRRAVLVASSAFTLLAVLLFALAGGPWWACLAVVALGSAVNSPGRYAVLPAAAHDAHLPLPRVNGWMEMGGAAAIVGGAALGWALSQPGWPADGPPLSTRVLVVLLALNLVAFLAALAVSFPSDVLRPEPPRQAIAGFFRDALRVARSSEALGLLLGLAALQALVTAGPGAVVELARGAGGGLLKVMLLVGLGAALGCGAASLQGHPHRSLGLVPYGATGLVLALLWAIWGFGQGIVPFVPWMLLGFMSGLVNVPLRAAYLAAVPADARGNGMSVMNAAIYVVTLALAGALFGLGQVGALTTSLAQLAVLAALAALGAGIAWWLLRMPALELPVELAFLPFYRVRARGPGAELIPPRGPLLLVSNHAAYLDPLWLGKLVPRRLTPMMSSVFYDKPVLRWLMKYVAGTIRVQSGTFRREAPELAEAAAALRRGRCVLIFPEGRLRRNEEPILRTFGQGAWHILRELPDTPVVACWIEGGWGSYLSYKNGPPRKNKPFDWGRLVEIAFAEPAPVPAEVLADQRATRLYLMRACLECRRHLGLEVPPLPGEADVQEKD